MNSLFRLSSGARVYSILMKLLLQKFTIACATMVILGGLALPSVANAAKIMPSFPTKNQNLLPTIPARITATNATQALGLETVTQTLLIAQATITASKAKNIALQKNKGSEVVDISREGEVYRVRLIRSDGVVIDVFIDAATGKVKE